MALIDTIVSKLERIAQGSEGLLAKATAQTLVKLDPMTSMKSSGGDVEFLPHVPAKPKDAPDFATRMGNFSDMFKGMGFSGTGEKLGQVSTIARAGSGDPTAIIDLVNQKVGEFTSGFSRMGSGITSPNDLKGMSEITGGIGQVLSSIGGPAGDLANRFLKLGSVAIDLVDKLKGWTSQLHQSNMQFAEFSSSMATVQAQQKVRDIQLSMEQGERRAASAEYLAEGKNKLDREAAPIEDAFANFKNYLGGLLANETSKLLKPVNAIAKKLGLSKDPPKDTPLSHQLRWLSDDRIAPWHKNEGVPDGRFGN